MNDIKKIEENSHYAHFIDRLMRWHKIKFDSKTMIEMKTTLSRVFIKEDFDFCERILMEDEQKKFNLSAADIYKICLKSKYKRLKAKRLKTEIESNNNYSFDKAGKEKVKEAFKELSKALANNKKDIKVSSSNERIILYDYLDFTGKIQKVIADGDIDEKIFKDACKNKFYSSPHTIKKIYHKTVNKEQIDKNGEISGNYTTFISVSSNLEGSKIQTIGYF